MKEYHGILVGASLKDRSVLDSIKIIGKREEAEDWTLYKIEVDPAELDETINLIGENLK